MQKRIAIPLLFICLFLCGYASAQVKIGDNPQTIDPTSVLELESTERVLVITRVNSIQMSNIKPSRGALVYNTTADCVFYFNGTDWINLCGGDGAVAGFTTDPIVNPQSTIVITPTPTGGNIEIGKNSINSSMIIDGGVNGVDIQNGSIGRGKLQNSSVDQTKLAENSVGPFAIDNDNIDLADFNNVTGFIRNTDLAGLQSSVDTNTAAIAADGDTNATNELQDLTLSGNTIVIENGNTIDLTPILSDGGTDDQTLTLNGNILEIEDGNTVDFTQILDDSAGDPTTIASTTTVTVSGTGTPTDPYELTSVGGGGGDDDQTAAEVPVAATPANYTAATADVEAHLVGIDAALATTGGGGNQNLGQVLTEGNDGGAALIKNILNPVDDQDAATKSYVDAAVTTGGGGLADGNIFVGDATGAARPVAISGDATIDNAGVLTIGNGTVDSDKIADANVTLAKIQPLTPAPATDQMLITNSAGTIAWAPAATGGGEINTAANLGAAGVGTFVAKTAAELQFKNINGAASGIITVTDDAADNEIDLDIADGTIDPTAKLEPAVALTPAADQMLITNAAGTIAWAPAATGGGEINTAANLGAAGVGTFVNKNAAELQFKNINGAASGIITVTDDAIDNEIDLDIADGTIDPTAKLEPAVALTPAADQMLITNAAGTIAWAPASTGGGEINTATNLGAAGVGTFVNKNAAELQFKNINGAASGIITVTDDAADNEIDLDIADGTIDPTAKLEPAVALTPAADQMLITNAAGTVTWAPASTGGNNLQNTNLVQTDLLRTYELTNANQNLVFTGLGNIGIGNGANPPQNKFHVAGEIRSQGYNSSQGSESFPAYSFSTGDDSDTGMYRPAADQIGFSVGGNEALRIEEPSANVTKVVVNQSLELDGPLIDFNNATGNPGNVLKVNATGNGVEWTANTGFGVDTNPLKISGNGDTTPLSIENDAITAAELAIDAVTTVQIAPKTITSGDIGDEQIRPINIELNSIDRSLIETGAVETDEILNETILNVDIAPNAAIAGSKINPDFGNLAIATTGNIDGNVITATGNLVTTGGSILKGAVDQHPDYVFQKYFLGSSVLKADYNFKTLEQIETFVKKHHHLPGIKSAAQVKKEGVWDIGASNIQNLEKIEELYLHTIAQEKKIDRLQSEKEVLSDEIKALRNDLDEIKALLKKSE